MLSLAVILVTTCVLLTELLQLRQDHDEAICAFAARVHRKAETCAFAAPCECGKSINYTDNVILRCLEKYWRRRTLSPNPFVILSPFLKTRNWHVTPSRHPHYSLYQLSSTRRKHPLQQTETNRQFAQIVR